MTDRTKEYVEFTKICGDCGRRFKTKFEISEDEKPSQKLMNLFFEKYGLCCKKCGEKK